MRRIAIVLLLFAASTLTAQVAMDVESAYRQQFEKSPREKLFLHTGKTTYLAGETVWFRVFHVSTRQHQPFPFSKVVYVELLKGDDVRRQVKVSIGPSGGAGSFQLPADIASGNYTIRAYTQWMRNFGPELFFRSNLLIVNPFKRLDLQEPPKAFTARFFPEGGKLVAGLTSTVGVQVVDAFGTGVDFEGTILANDDTIAWFKNIHNGLSKFEINPREGMIAMVESEGSIIEFELPPVRASGSVMSVQEIGKDKYELSVASTHEQKMHLAAISRDEFLWISEVNAEGKVSFNSQDLRTGVNQLTLFDAHGLPVAERLVFRQPEHDLVFKGIPAKQTFNSRERVDVKLMVDMSGNPLSGEMSVSVFQQGLPERYQDIQSSLWLTSEIAGRVQDPASYFNDGMSEALDLVMLTHGWRVYNYELPELQYLPEFTGTTLTGSTTDSGVVYITYPDSVARTFTSTVRGGRFTIDLDNTEGNGDVYIKSDAPVELESAFSTSAEEAVPLDLDTAYTDAIVAQSSFMQVQNQFQEVKSAVSRNKVNFYQNPTSRYYLDEFTRFPVMEEVMREYVYGVFVRKENGVFVFKVIDDARNELMQDLPLILLDGVPVSNVDGIMNLDPLDIKRIDVIRRKYFYGNTFHSGIVAFYSYKSDFARYPIEAEAIKVTYQGLQSTRTFYSPAYESTEQKESRTPDFRNQLYWNPCVKVDNGKAVFSFYTSDAKGSYIIELQTLGYDGSAGSHRATLLVK